MYETTTTTNSELLSNKVKITVSNEQKSLVIELLSMFAPIVSSWRFRSTSLIILPLQGARSISTL